MQITLEIPDEIVQGKGLNETLVGKKPGSISTSVSVDRDSSGPQNTQVDFQKPGFLGVAVSAFITILKTLRKMFGI